MTGSSSGLQEKATGEGFLAVRGLSKSFGANKVLKDVSLTIRAGEIVVLLGPNGAGKSTMLNIVGGTLEPSEGSLYLDGQPVDLQHYSGGVARARGIQRVFQELSTFPNLSVAENLALTSARAGAGSRKELIRQARDRMRAFPRNRVSVNSAVSELSVAERQMVEITRAMTEPGTRLVILDEPTSALSAEEADQLADLVERKAAEGVAIIYVTHKLEEAIRLAHRIVVLRDGKLHWDGDGRNVTHDELLALLGAAVEHKTEAPAQEIRDRRELLSISGLATAKLHDIHIRVGEGEVIGIAGLEGAGQRDLLQAIFDARGKQSRSIQSSTDIAYVSGDRKREGLLPLWSVEDNVAISAAPRFSRFGLVDFAGLKQTAHEWLDELGLRHRAKSDIVALSGGNQQRALLGRALASEAPLLLLDDPTRGVDVSAKGSIYELFDKLKDKGRSAILYSTEVGEFLKCDRVYVMARGHVVAEFNGAEATEERIVQASFLRPDGTGKPAVAAEPHRPSRESGIAHALSWRALPAALLMVGMFLLAISLQPRVLSPFGLELLLQASVTLAFAVIAQMLFILGGDIDLGLGFAVGLANVIAATYLVDNPTIGIVYLAALILGYVLLAVIVEVLGVSSVVATLGSSFVWLGLGLIIRETPGGVSPGWMAAIAKLKLWPLPFSLYLLVILALAGLWITKGWSYSIRLRALGHNRRTYQALGYSALKGRMTIYALAGTFAVLSGLWITGSTGAGNINVAASFTLSTVAAVIVGGASFSGGLVSAGGAVMAIVGISLITTNLVFLGISSEYSTALGGIVLILALSLRSLTRSRQS